MQFKIFLLAAWSLTSIIESSPGNTIKRAIKIYNGPGVSKPLVKEINNSFSKLLSTRYNVHEVYPEELAESDWISETDLLIIPGGQATPYSKSLEGRANSNILKYVNEGGSFMGICAGAYYASRVTQFMVDTPYEKVVERNLKFFKGISKGTTFPGYKPNTEEGAYAANITFYPPDEKNNSHTSVYYNGGGAFLDAANYPGVEILATYDGISKSENVATIYVPVGKGKVILSHVHPEYIPDEHDEPFYNELHTERDTIINLLNGWFSKLGLKLRSDDKDIQLQSQPSVQTTDSIYPTPHKLPNVNLHAPLTSVPSLPSTHLNLLWSNLVKWLPLAPTISKIQNHLSPFRSSISDQPSPILHRS